MARSKTSSTEVYFNAKVYTADSSNPQASAFVVRAGNFIYVGDDKGALAYGEGKNLGGRRVLPGLVESHCHVIGSAVNPATTFIFVSPETTAAELPEVLAESLKSPKFNKQRVLKGMGFNPGADVFCAADIDKAVPERPFFMFGDDGHTMLLNTAALRYANIDKNTPDPTPGESYFVRDENGNPTGLVVEIEAMLYVRANVPELQNLYNAAGIKASVKNLTRYGFTTAFDAATCQADSKVMEVLRKMDSRHALNIRCHTSFIYAGEEALPLEDVMEALKEQRAKFSSERLIPDTLKMIADGTVENLTAHLAEPYEGVNEENYGSELLSLEEMCNAAKAASEEGFNVHIHAIGDAAIDKSITALSSIGPSKGTKTIAHNEVYNEALKERLVKEGDIFYQTTPYWTIADENVALRYLGAERYKNLFPIGSLALKGVKVAFGSDSLDGEVGLSPFVGIFLTVHRGMDTTGLSLPGREEGISIEEAVNAYTISGAELLGAADKVGSITSGKKADFIILDRDIFSIPLIELFDTIVEEVYLDGERIYKAAPDSVPFETEEAQYAIDLIKGKLI
ncbi:MAG: amidohydrolase family protein [Bacteroidales bacterium]|nr:amidohydrolase family protein [Bacteroidales bacterium]